MKREKPATLRCTITRRRAGGMLAGLVATSLSGALETRPALAASDPAGPLTPEAGRSLYAEAVASVLPEKGHMSRVELRDAVLKLIQHGAIDPEKFEAMYRGRGGLPAELRYLMRWPSHLPIRLTRENAALYVNILWPLGLANHLNANDASPLNGPSLGTFASTGGWSLGKAASGGEYFNKLPIVEITPEQEALAAKVAKSTYRPCCDNSTFFQDCNHGSALLGMLELGAAQGLSEDELFREALAFNSFWFPDNYLRTALYFKVVEKKDWAEVDPRIVMGARYSSLSMWQAQVQTALARIPNLIPEEQGGAGCGA
ncbi:MAG: hypothetical protein AB7I59_02540 [Geminicoccaceae bacterium]